MRGLLEPWDDPARQITLVPIETMDQARTFLVRWLACYRLCRIAQEAQDLLVIGESRQAVRREMRRRHNAFVD